MKRFIFHYNKPYSQRFKTHKWTVHYENVCHIVDSIDCRRPCESKLNKRQPVCVMRGFASGVRIEKIDGKDCALIQ